jgi:hypothetical protein
METQKSVADWCEQTFGPARDARRVLVRANLEMAELLNALDTGAPAEKVAEEAADVLIVLSRLGERHEVNLWVTVEETNSSTGWAFLANEKMADLLRVAAYGVHHTLPMLSVRELAHYLALLTSGLGVDLAEAIDRKMVVNRARAWKLDGTGCGQHVPQP